MSMELARGPVADAGWAEASERPHRRALDYVVFTVLTRLLAFAALLILAGRLAQGGYGRFALLYQVGLFVSYQLSWPLVVSGYRLGDHAVSGFLRRAGLAGFLGALVGGGGGAIAVQGWSWTVAALAVFTATTTAGAVAYGQAQALGRARSYARWTTLAALFFVLAAVALPSAGWVLLAFGLANLLPIAVLLVWLRGHPREGERQIGRPQLAVFVWGVAFNLAFVLALRLADGHLSALAADRFALGFTLLQAALAIPLQLMTLLQPRLIDQGERYRERYASSQSVIAVLLMICGLVGAGLAAVAGWDEWRALALLSLSLPGLSFGLIGIQAYLLGRAASAKQLLPGSLVLLGVMTVGLAGSWLTGAHLSLTTVGALWAAAATAAALVEALAQAGTSGRRYLVELGLAPVAGALAVVLAVAVDGWLLLPLGLALALLWARSGWSAAFETLRLVAGQSR